MSDGRHPPCVLLAEITHVSPSAVETRTRAGCGGVPMWISKVDQGPSLPSLNVGTDVSVVYGSGWLCETTHQCSLAGTTTGAAAELFAMPLRDIAETDRRERRYF